MAWISARFSLDVGPHSSVTEPPSPPAPLTFQPIAPCCRAISMICLASSLIRPGCRWPWA